MDVTAQSQSDRVVDRIRKLLALAQSNNQHEAKLAAERASELLIKHNLTLQRVQSPANDYDLRKISLGLRVPFEIKCVVSLLQDHFFVACVYDRSHHREAGHLLIIGKKTNTEIATYLFEFLSRTFTKLWQSYRIEHRASVRSRRAFFDGLYSGIDDQLKAKRCHVEQEAGLIVVPDPQLNEKVYEFVGSTRIKQSYVRPYADEQAEAIGRRLGENLRINHGIQHSKPSSGLALPDNRGQA